MFFEYPHLLWLELLLIPLIALYLWRCLREKEPTHNFIKNFSFLLSS